MTSVGVIAHARKELGGGLGALRDSLRRHGIDDPLWREVPKSKFAPKEVGELIDDGVDLLFVWGGDGMVQRCIDAIGKAPVTLAIVPAGTANLFASNLGIPKDLEQAVRIGLKGHRRTLDVGSINGERFAVMAGNGFDAAMIRGADGGMKDRLGRLAYVVTGMRAVRRDAVETRIEVDGRPWFKGAATLRARRQHGRRVRRHLRLPRRSARRRPAGRRRRHRRRARSTGHGRSARRPSAARLLAVRRDDDRREDRRSSSTTKPPYELDGGDRPKTKRLKFRVKPAAIIVCVPERKERTMSTANLVPETWELTGDDAKETLAAHRPQGAREGRGRCGCGTPTGSATRGRWPSCTFLVFVQGVIARRRHRERARRGGLSRAIVKVLQSIVPGPAGQVLTQAVHQAHQAGSSGQWIAIVVGTVGALVTGTTLMGQIERALNRIYGIERDRATAREVRPRVPAGRDRGHPRGARRSPDWRSAARSPPRSAASTASTIWNVVRWPIGIGLLIAATALVFRWAPRRRQPGWSWLSVGALAAVGLLALVTIALNLFFQFSTTFGSTYGPLAGHHRAGVLVVPSALAAFLYGCGARRRSSRPFVPAWRPPSSDAEGARVRAAGRPPGGRRLPIVGAGVVTPVAPPDAPGRTTAGRAPTTCAARWRASSASRRPKGTPSRSCATGRDLPGDARGIDGAEPHGRPADVRLLAAARSGRALRRGARRSAPGRRPRPRAARRVGRAPDRPRRWSR